MYFTSHDEFVVDNVVRRESHPKQSTGGVQVTGHPSPAVHILTNTLQDTCREKGRERCMYMRTRLQVDART